MGIQPSTELSQKITEAKADWLAEIKIETENERKKEEQKKREAAEKLAAWLEAVGKAIPDELHPHIDWEVVIGTASGNVRFWDLDIDVQIDGVMPIRIKLIHETVTISQQGPKGHRFNVRNYQVMEFFISYPGGEFDPASRERRWASGRCGSLEEALGRAAINFDKRGEMQIEVDRINKKRAKKLEELQRRWQEEEEEELRKLDAYNASEEAEADVLRNSLELIMADPVKVKILQALMAAEDQRQRFEWILEEAGISADMAMRKASESFDEDLRTARRRIADLEDDLDTARGRIADLESAR